MYYINNHIGTTKSIVGHPIYYYRTINIVIIRLSSKLGRIVHELLDYTDNDIVIVLHDHLTTSIEEHILSPKSHVYRYDHTSHKSTIQIIIIYQVM